MNIDMQRDDNLRNDDVYPLPYEGKCQLDVDIRENEKHIKFSVVVDIYPISLIKSEFILNNYFIVMSVRNHNHFFRINGTKLNTWYF